MRFYYPTDKNGNQIGFKTPESQVYDKNGVSLTDKLEDIDGRLTALYGEDDEVSVSVSELSKKIDTTNTTVSNLGNTVNGLNESVNNLKTKTDTTNTNVSNLNDTVNSNYNALNSRISELNNKFQGLVKVSSFDANTGTLRLTSL